MLGRSGIGMKPEENRKPKKKKSNNQKSFFLVTFCLIVQSECSEVGCRTQ